MSVLDGAHDAAGARWTGTGPVRVPRNYGDPAAEYEAARGGAVVADRSDRRFVRVYGRDPVKMMQGLISNDIANAPPDRAVYAAVLTPKGKMIADVRVVRHGADLLLETDAAAVEPLMAHFRKFVPPLFARFEDASGAWSEVGVYGPRARATIEHVLDTALRAEPTEDDLAEATLGETPLLIIGTAGFGVPGFDILVPADGVERVWNALSAAGARPVGHATLDVLRIEAGTPRWGAELTENTIPLEAGLRTRAISETKGCYTGQEVIVRILHRGHVNWLLRGVLLGDAAAPSRDTPLVDPTDQRKVGRITSSAWSPRLGQTIALAYVRREVEPGAIVALESGTGNPVRVMALPFPADPADAAPDF
ncbi:MAG TPA: glycine cleavage T C-terminal barrel domain-containing protein [Longimicrobiales bacterium]